MSGKNETAIDTIQRASHGRRWERLSIEAILLLCAGLLLGVPGAAYADSTASSTISFSNLIITPSGGSVSYGTLTSSPYTQAQNSLGEIDNGTTSASVTWANATANSSVLDLTGSASGNSSILNVTGSANTTGQAILNSTTFEITSLDSGSVDVTFSADLTGNLSVYNDSEGVLATAEAAFNLDLNGSPILSYDNYISAGPRVPEDPSFGTNLTNTVSLDYNTPYTFYILADAETSAENVVTPEPSTVVLSSLSLLGIAVYALGTKRRSTLGKHASA